MNVENFFFRFICTQNIPTLSANCSITANTIISIIIVELAYLNNKRTSATICNIKNNNRSGEQFSVALNAEVMSSEKVIKGKSFCGESLTFL